MQKPSIVTFFKISQEVQGIFRKQMQFFNLFQVASIYKKLGSIIARDFKNFFSPWDILFINRKIPGFYMHTDIVFQISQKLKKVKIAGTLFYSYIKYY